MRRKRKEAEALHHERWLVSYADFMTLLFALFVVLFASSHHDQESIRKVSSAVKDGFQKMGAFSKSQDDDSSVVPNQPSVAADTNGDVLDVQKKLADALGTEIERKEVGLQMTPEGFVISLHELGFFDSGQAKLLPGAEAPIKRIAEVLMQYGLDMRVEGHSDDVPIHNAVFSSNWDLSTARATAVAMMLLNDSNFDPKKMSIAGYGQYHPAESNDTEAGRKANRRVDIVIVSAKKSPPMTEH